MARDMMIRCEEKRLHKIDGKKEWRWVQVAVGDISSDGGKEIRCLYCSGEVKVHKQKAAAGPQVHLEHRSRQDAEHCQGGHNYGGHHQPSANPVL